MMFKLVGFFLNDLFYMYVRESLCGCVSIHAGACGDQKKVCDPGAGVPGC